MTEDEWLTGNGTWSMLGEVLAGASDRKLRLTALSSCERGKPHIEDWYHYLIPLAESFVEGLIDRNQLAVARSECDLRTDFEDREAFVLLLSDDLREHVQMIVDALDHWIGRCKAPEETPDAEAVSIDEQEKVSAHTIRDIFGNPFRPVGFDPAWRTEHAVGIAAKMYDERDFRAMSILADALEEAGCNNADILSHCREPGVHVRGCWVVDLVLGKE